MLHINWNFSGLGWCILDFSKPVGQVGFGAHSEAKLVSQFMQTKSFCHKMSQNSTVFSVSYSSDCTCIVREVHSPHFYVQIFREIDSFNDKSCNWFHEIFFKNTTINAAAFTVERIYSNDFFFVKSTLYSMHWFHEIF